MPIGSAAEREERTPDAWQEDEAEDWIGSEVQSWHANAYNISDIIDSPVSSCTRTEQGRFDFDMIGILLLRVYDLINIFIFKI